MLTFRHRLRFSEAVGLKRSDVDTEGCGLGVARLKRSGPPRILMRAHEVPAVKAWLTERARMQAEGEALFVSERPSPLSRKTARP